MATKDLKSIKFPGLEDVYKIPAGGSGGTGQDGKDGITPTIGENGNWYLGDEDTGKPSRGATGPQGATGEVKGTFYVTVTQGNGDSATADKTAAEVYAAYAAGYAVYAIVKFRNGIVPYTLPLLAAVSFSGTVMLGFATIGSSNADVNPQGLVVLYNGAAWSAWSDTLAKIQDIPTVPTELPNPYSLNIKIGDATTSYDGSAAKTVEIPDVNAILPPFTTADNDKVLGIVNGALAWVAKA